ncbi:MAG: histidine phosphatase family protein [Deltaproteobacteria bacterium]|nr:histidine phosphatase family protein [Deltaproteobacteria bacterium]
MSDIYMIRHGQASFSSENYDRLSRLGCLQSRILGEYLSHIRIYFDAIYSGSLERQRHTAEQVLERMPADVRCDLRIQPDLNEYDAKGIVESQVPAMIRDDPKLALDLERIKERRSFQRIFEGAMRRWLSGRYDAEGVEPWKVFRDRVQGAVNRIMMENGRGRTIALFTSGGPICVTLQMALGITADIAIQLNWQLRNTSVSVFKYSDKGIFLNSYNSLNHLLDRKDSALLTYR